MCDVTWPPKTNERDGYYLRFRWLRFGPDDEKLGHPPPGTSDRGGGGGGNI